MNNPLVSIIIPAFNSEKTIEKCIKSLLRLNYQSLEIIIINDGSTDNTEKILDNYANNKHIRIFNTQNAGPSNARNLGIRESKGNYIAFTDADCLVHPEWLIELLKGFDAHPSPIFRQLIVGVGGCQLSPEDDSRFGKLINSFMKSIGFITGYMKSSGSSITNIKKTNHNPSCNVIYKKDIFNKVGDFLENLWPGEDVELDYRITKSGYYLMFNPKAIVYHYRPSNISKFIKMMNRYGQSQAKLFKMYGCIRKIQSVPVFIIIYLVTLLFFSIENILNLPLLLLITVIFIYSYFLLKSKSFFLGLKYSWLFYLTLFHWNFGFLKGLFSKRP